MANRFIVTMIFVIASINSALAGVPAELKNAIKERVDFGLAQSIVIGVYQDNQARYFAYGTTDIQGGTKADNNTIFEIGSISKVFVTTLLADKVIQGRIKLDDKISSFLPPKCRSKQLDDITFEMLATHYSGLPRMPTNYTPPYYDLNPAGYSEEAFCQYLASAADKTASGVEYTYSNLGFGLLGYLLEKIEGKDLNSQLKQTILQPLAMNNSGIGIDNIDVKSLAQGHHGQIRTAYFPNGMLDGSGAILSTASDLMGFLKAILNGGDTTLSKALALTLQSKRSAWDKTDIGLGWHIQKNHPDQTIYWHNGSTGGFHAFIGFDQSQQKAVVVLSNSGGDGNDDLGLAFLTPEHKVKPTPKHREIRLEKSHLRQFVGTYDTEFGLPIEITIQGGQLKAKFGDQFALNIYAKSENTFFYRAINASISFEQNADGITLLLHQDGETYPAKFRQPK